MKHQTAEKSTPIPKESEIPSVVRDSVALAIEQTEQLGVELPEYKYEPTVAEDAPLPDWVVMPTDLAFPKGRTIGYMRFRARWTDRPDLGDRQCILWNLTAADEKLAVSRTRGDSMRVISELAKQMIRAIDGVRADWTGQKGPGNVMSFWEEIGTKCRTQIQNYYIKMHTLSAEDQADFFANCIDIRTAT